MTKKEEGHRESETLSEAVTVDVGYGPVGLILRMESGDAHVVAYDGEKILSIDAANITQDYVPIRPPVLLHVVRRGEFLHYDATTFGPKFEPPAGSLKAPWFINQLFAAGPDVN